MMRDEIIDEVRAVKEALAEQFGFDARLIFEDIKRSEMQSEAEGWQHIAPPASPVPDSSLRRVRFTRR
jgi:hypothetical protein